MKLTYAQQLAHPLWQRRRLEMLQAAGWKCTECRSADKSLHVHHKQYFKGRMAWDYADGQLQVLCADCHEKSHELDEQLKAILAQVPQAEVLALLVGFYSGLLNADQFDKIYCDNDGVVNAGLIAEHVKNADQVLIDGIYRLIVDADQERAK